MIVASTSNPPKDSPYPLQCPMITSSNYNIWSIKMEAIMDAHGLWDTIEPPTGVVVDEKKSKQARAFIFQSIPEKMLAQAAKKKTTKEAWDSLKSRYVGSERVQKARLWVLKSEFEALQMKETETIDEYVGKISSMISKFGSAGAILEDEELEASGHLKAYEDRLQLRKANSSGDNALLLAKLEGSSSHRSPSKTGGRGRGASSDRGGRSGTWGRGSTRGSGRRWGGSSRQEANNSNRKPREKSHIRCYECQELGHYASECNAKKHQDQEVNLAADEDGPALLLTVHGEENTSMVLLNEEKVYPNQLKEKEDNNMWYLDNGASNHMTGFKDLFAELDEKVTGQVRFGDGSKVPIKGKGTLLFDCKNGD
ncbi:uncharacterized protein LOC111879096 [Lactuca sativa]|uniref:uncharacterized protein LOC111879096 n=1 Tax=Lactuca sativa TaxID=4236 RepID=UPI000CD9E647|nr:uncharacterized protein LOC111879096 [Lactuca sativa]